MIKKIYNQILNNFYAPHEVGLLNGVCSELIFFHEIEKKHPTLITKDISNKVEYNRDLIYTSIENDEVTLNYADGLTGILAAKYILNNSKTFNLNFIEDEEIEDVIIEEAIINFENNNYDFFYGGLGLIQPLLLKYRNADLSNNDYIQKLVATIFQTHDGMLWLHKKPNEYNLGISHGIIGIIYLLANFCKEEDKPKLQIILENFIKLAKLNSKYSVFPNIYYLNGENDYNSRLAWCYGDLGIANLLFDISVKLNNLEVRQFAINLALRCVNRKDLKQNRVIDASICHGTTGVAMIFLKFYHHTHNLKFVQAYNYWKIKTKKFYRSDDDVCCFKYNTSGQLVNNFGLLEGLAGIGLGIVNNGKYEQYYSLFSIN